MITIPIALFLLLYLEEDHYSDMMRAPRKVYRERVHGHHLLSTGQTVSELLVL
jgi:hypothetical protein